MLLKESMRPSKNSNVRYEDEGWYWGITAAISMSCAHRDDFLFATQTETKEGGGKLTVSAQVYVDPGQFSLSVRRSHDAARGQSR